MKNAATISLVALLLGGCFEDSKQFIVAENTDSSESGGTSGTSDGSTSGSGSTSSGSTSSGSTSGGSTSGGSTGSGSTSGSHSTSGSGSTSSGSTSSGSTNGGSTDTNSSGITSATTNDGSTTDGSTTAAILDMGDSEPDYPPNCLNGLGVIDPGEECDCGFNGCDLNGQTCQSLGFNGGSLFCWQTNIEKLCQFNTGQCW